MACKACRGEGHNRATCGRVEVQRTPKVKRTREEINRKKDERLELAYPGLLDRIGKESDVDVGKAYGITRAYIQMIRKRRGNDSFAAERKEQCLQKLDELEAAGVLGVKSDRKISREYGIPLFLVVARRNKLGIKRFRGASSAFLDTIRHRVGVDSDCALSEEFGISVSTIYGYRIRNKIPCSQSNLNRVPKMTVTRTMYSWDNWVDGEEHTIVKGTDFNCGMWSMSSRLRSEAASRGRRVSIAINMKDKVITFRFAPAESV